MHENLAVILQQFNYGKNSLAVLVPARQSVGRFVLKTVEISNLAEGAFPNLINV